MESWEAVAEQSYDVDAPQLLRLGVKTGDFGDGTAVVRLTTQG